ncbi:MAG: methyltransferase domain-containing protein [Planctomycetes bacterium]|nr:methyltransferase domain-containing protein [Planctomycetota bacterium]
MSGESLQYARMEASVYDQFAELEDHHFWFRGRREIFFDLLDRELGDRTDRELLEVGCGPGGFLGPLQRYGRVFGLDIAHDAMAYCRSRGYENCITGSGHALPFADASFDFVGLFDTIEHIPDDEAVLREVRRVIRPDGCIFISVPAYQFLYSQNDRLVHHCRRYRRGPLKRLLRKTGFRVTKATYFNTFLFPLILPAVLTVKLKERLVGLPDEETNLSHEFPGIVNDTFARFMGSEKLLLRNMSFPFGHSLIAIARPAT